MNAIDALLNFNPDDIKDLKKDVPMKLKKLNGLETVFPIQALSTEDASKIQDNSFKFLMGSGKDLEMENMSFEAKVDTLILGCPSVFRNDAILAKFKVLKAKDLINKILTPEEVDYLKKEIDELSGYDADELPTDGKTEDAVKN